MKQCLFPYQLHMLHSRSDSFSPKHGHVLLLLFLAAGMLNLFLPPLLSAAPLNLNETSLRRTVSLYQRNGCLTSAQLAYGKEIIKGLNYTSQRVFRAFCSLPNLDFSQYQQIWSALLNHQLNFEQMQCFERWIELGQPDLALSLKAVETIHTLSFDSAKTFRALLELPDVTQGFSLEVIALFNSMKPGQLLATESMLTIKDMTAAVMIDLIPGILRLDGHQNTAARAYAGLRGMHALNFADALPLFAMLQQEDAWNARCLYQLKQVEAVDGWDWLVGFFALPDDIQEKQFYQLDPARQRLLLQAMFNGGEVLIWRINNLHSITDRFGVEISNAALRNSSANTLQKRMDTLSPLVRTNYSHRFETARRAKDRRQMLALLRRAVAAERKHVAESLTSANIYLLLAQGSELYDSSFRDILVPVLHRRIENRFNGDLMAFLNETDTAGEYVADFITGCAQKGKLITFLPEDGHRQRQVLDLVARSAFRDEPSLLLFSATMLPLIEVLQPVSRQYLVARMIGEAQRLPEQPASLITVILQYYRQFYARLLTAETLGRITALEERYGSISFARYQQTPFSRWLNDKTLTGLSLFHPDDDGRQSFLSFSNRLKTDGYTLSEATAYNTHAGISISKEEILRWINKAKTGSPADVANLFASMQRDGYTVAFSKKIKDRTVHHVLSVYSNKERQQALLLHFIEAGDEMLSQRGHSYWRKDQLISPLESLLNERRISRQALQGRQRFFSLGSCGGVKVYTKLIELMEGRVDLLATIGTGLTPINDAYNKVFLEVIAGGSTPETWDEMNRRTQFIFQSGRGQDYLHPGSLTAILHKIIKEREADKTTSATLQDNSLNQG